VFEASFDRDGVKACLHRVDPADGLDAVLLPGRLLDGRRRGEDSQSASLERAGELTPYAMEVIAEDAARAGRGARLEVTMPASADDLDLAVVREELAHLGRRGVEVRVRRDVGADEKS